MVALFIPGYTRPEHARQAVQADQKLLYVTGHRDHGGPWLPIGIGVHTSVAYLGAIVGSRGIGADITAIGDDEAFKDIPLFLRYQLLTNDTAFSHKAVLLVR